MSPTDERKYTKISRNYVFWELNVLEPAHYLHNFYNAYSSTSPNNQLTSVNSQMAKSYISYLST